MGSIKFCSPDCVQFLFSWLCLFDAIIKLHACNEKNIMFNGFLIRE